MVLTIRVKPRSKTSSLTQEAPGEWTACLRSPPVDGKANDELIELVAKRFGVPKSRIRILAGAKARRKLVELAEQ